jgi:hypothetical protein
MALPARFCGKSDNVEEQVVRTLAPAIDRGPPWNFYLRLGYPMPASTAGSRLEVIRPDCIAGGRLCRDFDTNKNLNE